MPTEPSTPDVRVSDADRDDIADAMRRHWVDGRLSVEELDERLAAVYAARTERQLAELLSDLPEGSSQPVVAATPAASRWRPGRWRRPRVGLPGVRPFVQHHDFEAEKEQVFADALSHIAPGMITGGYDLAERVEPTLLAFETRERPARLLRLRVRQTSRIVMAFDDASEGGTRVTVRGMARRAVRRAFATLSD
jgi:hypothetical protein